MPPPAGSPRSAPGRRSSCRARCGGQHPPAPPGCPSRHDPGRRVHAAGAGVDRLQARRASQWPRAAPPALSRTPGPTGFNSRTACSTVSWPQSPQPVRPVRFRLRSSSAEKRSQATRDSDLGGVFSPDHLHTADLIRARHQALAQRKADRVVLEVGRGRKHRHMRDAVIDERDRHLFGERSRSRVIVPRCQRSTSSSTHVFSRPAAQFRTRQDCSAPAVAAGSRTARAGFGSARSSAVRLLQASF